MKKRFFALLCALTLCLPALPAAALEGESQRAADTLAELSLISGYGSGYYATEAPATRTHAAVLLTRLAGITDAALAAAPKSPFHDQPVWASPAINYAVSQGWITGMDPQTFAPELPLTANAWCTMLLRLLGYRDSSGDFLPGEAARFAWRIGMTSQLYEGELTRGQWFQITLDALTFPRREGDTLTETLVATGRCTRQQAREFGLLDTELTARQIADRCTAAIGSLTTYATAEDYAENQPAGNSSVFFISADGLAVTCYHSIADAQAATVTLVTGEIYPVTGVVIYDPAIDFAVLRVSTASTEGDSTSAFAHLQVVGKEELRPGDAVYALGNPLGKGIAVSNGIISATERDVERYALPCILNTASISQGSSGGALVNAFGHVVAITSGAYAYGNDMYLAIPADHLLSIDLTGAEQTLEEVCQAEADNAEG